MLQCWSYRKISSVGDLHHQVFGKNTLFVLSGNKDFNYNTAALVLIPEDVLRLKIGMIFLLNYRLYAAIVILNNTSCMLYVPPDRALRTESIVGIFSICCVPIQLVGDRTEIKELKL